MPNQIFKWMKEKWENILYQTKLEVQWKELHLDSDLLKLLEMNLNEQLHKDHHAPVALLADEQKIIREIKEQVSYHNRNNITRTEAYRKFYFEHPEIHWAFLAHMVSRNGGWNMTDLKGDLLPKLLDEQSIGHFFSFLERANALIFQDAYPQLLLYRESVKRKKNLFHLLPAFHISRFMKPFWDLFLKQKDPMLITLALIINEQNYIEKRVANHPYYKQMVFDTAAFQSQAAMQLNQVVFPYFVAQNIPELRLAGIVLEDFTNLTERIEVGKRLYAILYGIKTIHEGAKRFAIKIKHTGSRADYWPHLFSKEPQAQNRKVKERLSGCKLKQHAHPFYSPMLERVWSDVPVQSPDRFDWFRDLSCMKYLQSIKMPSPIDITLEHCSRLNRIELAVLALENVRH